MCFLVFYNYIVAQKGHYDFFFLHNYMDFILLSSFNFETSLSWFIVQFQLQNFLILIYCPVLTTKLPYFDQLSIVNIEPEILQSDSNCRTLNQKFYNRSVIVEIQTRNSTIELQL